MSNSVKRNVIEEIFNRLRNKYPQEKKLQFHNRDIKKISGSDFSNQFDATKFDSEDKLPEKVRTEGFFIVHLGKGSHAFIKGKGYHKFEKIETIKEWKKGRSLIDTVSESEAQSISTAFNDKIIHDFLFGNINIEIKIHTARRARVSYKFVINDIILRADVLQIEMDGIYESGDYKTIAAVEVKNQEHETFEIRQLFSTMKYFEGMQRTQKIPSDYKIRILFMIRAREGKEDKFKIYEYKFENTEDPNSIKFVKAVQYNRVN